MSERLVKAVHEVSWHRNGVGGLGFYAVRFRSTRLDDSGREEEMLAAVFDEPGACAVVSLDRIPSAGVRFGANSWRGDRYEVELREAIKRGGPRTSGSVRVGPFGLPTEREP